MVAAGEDAGARTTSSSTWASYGSEDGDLGFVVYAKHTRTGLNSLGAEWRNEIQLGYFNNLSTSFYQPLDVNQRFFVEPKAFYAFLGRRVL